jgi:hypothetical protein
MSEHIDESANRELADYIEKCRAMHRSHGAPVTRFAHAVAALADERDRARDLLSEAVRMIEGYRRAGYLTNPAAGEQADDFIGRSK